MGKQEFLSILSEALNMELTPQEVSQNISYYSSYISGEVAKGKTEEEVIAELGDPRMIAKSIIEAARAAQEPYGHSDFEHAHFDDSARQNSAYQEEQRKGQHGSTNFEYRHNGKSYYISGKAVGVIVLVVVILVLALLLWIIGGILSILLPVLIPVALILLGVHLLRQR
ncbi:MAG: DUF1700 domain-containing protein [Lachnospiraceae bacterium]